VGIEPGVRDDRPVENDVPVPVDPESASIAPENPIASTDAPPTPAFSTASRRAALMIARMASALWRKTPVFGYSPGALFTIVARLLPSGS